MRTDKQIKAELLEKSSMAPSDYYATNILEKRGFHRKKCKITGIYFWTTDEIREVCGDVEAEGQVSIFQDNPASKPLSFTQVWSTFADHMHKRGYSKVKRYPVVARWNPTTDFTIASIAAFQPYVISGEVQAPAEKLVIPQFCLRFNDLDNVGVTGSHCTGFVMIGQHQFVSEQEWDQDQAFDDLLSYITDVVGIHQDELVLHEDAWAGGGNFGPCMEIFCRGIELCNQVYMLYEQTADGDKALNLKVLDMGLGQERIAWFTQGTPTLYDAAFPAVIEKLKSRTQVEFDQDLYAKFAPYSTLLNLDEVDDIAAAWQSVAEKVGVEVETLRAKIEPMKALYVVAEHARSLLVALTDGALPGNAGGYYNLRVIFRRAQDAIEDHGWNLMLSEVVAWHAQELKEQYPELQESLSDVQILLEVELRKYRDNRRRAKGEIQRALKKDIDLNALIELYDSKGISPEQVKREAASRQVKIEIPDNFYSLVSKRQEERETARTQTKRDSQLDLEKIGKTQQLYHNSYDFVRATAQVEFVEDNKVVLNRTAFYPTSGGQLHDLGLIKKESEEFEVVDVYKQGPHIIHVLKDASGLSVDDEVALDVDMSRRLQLSQHHTAAHVINGAARQVLGDHIWQAGAAKTVEKGRLDITHFEALTDDEMAQIEAVANDVVKKDLPIVKEEMKKSVAEARFGFRLYQGGAVPGDTIRVIDIPDFDTEACGGTHLNTTGELQTIKLLKSTKVQDGVVRIEYVAGAAASKLINVRQEILHESMEVLKIDDPALLAPRTAELFQKWKKVKKLRKKGKDVPDEMQTLTAKPATSADPLADASAAVSVQEEHLPKTLKRFYSEWMHDNSKSAQPSNKG